MELLNWPLLPSAPEAASTEIALVKLVNYIRSNLDEKILSVLVLLDLSASFDTVDHTRLLSGLKSTELASLVLF